MRILAIDTCLGSLSVAVAVGAPGSVEVVGRMEPAAAGHAERLAPMMRDVMAEAGVAFRDLTRIAVTLGPGTFTGVRTGIATARALRLATGAEIVGLSSLAVLAGMATRLMDTRQRAAAPAAMLVATDARRGNLYAALYGRDPLDEQIPPSELTPAAARRLIDTAARPAIVIGSGARLVVDAGDTLADVAILATITYPSAEELARLAPRLTPLRDVLPLYVREPDAKPQTGFALARMP